MLGRLARLLGGCSLAVGVALAPTTAMAASSGSVTEPIAVHLPKTVRVTAGSTSADLNVTVVCDPVLTLVLGGTLYSNNLFGNDEDEGYNYSSAVNRHNGFQCTGKPQRVNMYFYTTNPFTFTTSKETSTKAALSVQVHLHSEDGIGQVVLYDVPTSIIKLKIA